MLVKEAQDITGKLSTPSKMPGYSYNLPAVECNVGSALNKLKGSVCFDCYARKGRYLFENVKNAMYRRLAALAHPMWVEAMVFLISRYRRTKGYTHFRWHDSGDLQSMDHLANICEVCRRTPDVQHWLPTKEIHLVKRYAGDIPDNLCIRLSAFYIDEEPKAKVRNLPVSTVHRTKAPEPAHECLAYRTLKSGEIVSKDKRAQLRRSKEEPDVEFGFCGDCRACWDTEQPWVSYGLH